jgi:hypothetical protein
LPAARRSRAGARGRKVYREADAAKGDAAAALINNNNNNYYFFFFFFVGDWGLIFDDEERSGNNK